MHPWESRAEFRRRVMVEPDVSAKQILGLLDEIGFSEKLFWGMLSGVLVTAGATTKALADRFGYPGRHRVVPGDSGEDLDRALAAAPSARVYVLGDVLDLTHARTLTDNLASKGRLVVDVMRDLYPAWCAGKGGNGPRADDEPATTAAIVCPARSGSTYLSRLLAGTGQIGAVTENLRHHAVAMARCGGIDITEWFSRIAQVGAQDGVFVTKIIHAFLAELLDSCDDRAWSALVEQARAWKLITLSRDDVVDRTVSVYIAESTGTWHVHSRSELSNLGAQATDVGYDFERLNTIYRRLQRYDDLVARFVADRGGADLALQFQDLVESGVACTQRIIELLGKDTVAAESNIARLTRLPISSTTETNRAFAERFRFDLGL